MAQWLDQAKKLVDCGNFHWIIACSSCVCVGSVSVLRLPLTVQMDDCEVESSKSLCVCMGKLSSLSTLPCDELATRPGCCFTLWNLGEALSDPGHPNFRKRLVLAMEGWLLHVSGSISEWISFDFSLQQYVCKGFHSSSSSWGTATWIRAPGNVLVILQTFHLSSRRTELKKPLDGKWNVFKITRTIQWS